MTGKIFIQNLTKKSTLITSFYFDEKFKKKHNHLIFYLNNSIGFIYNDVKIWIYKDYKNESNKVKRTFI